MSVFDDFMREKGITKENDNDTYMKYKAIEKAFNIDAIENVDKTQMELCLRQLNIKSKQTFTNIKSRLKNVIEWAILNSIMNPNQLDLLQSITYEDIADSEVTSASYVSSPKELKNILNIDPNFTGKYNTFKAAFFLCWCGIKPPEIGDIKKDQVKKNGIVDADGELILVDDEYIIDFLNRYKNSTCFITEYFGRDTEMQYKDGIYLLRTYKNDHITYKQIRASTSRLSKEVLSKELSLGKVYESGMYYRMYLDEQKNGEFKAKQVERISNLYGKKISQQFCYRKLTDYRRWRDTFY